jgi:hypothetical protein
MDENENVNILLTTVENFRHSIITSYTLYKKDISNYFHLLHYLIFQIHFKIIIFISYLSLYECYLHIYIQILEMD